MFGLAALLVSIAVGARAQTYTAIDLGTLPDGSLPIAFGVNNSGQVVGYALAVSGPFLGEEAFLYSGGTMIYLSPLPGDSFSFASGINASGQVVGGSYTESGDEHAFLYSGGTMIYLGTLFGDPGSVASGINASGQVVGSAYNAFGYNVAFLYSGETMIYLGTRSMAEPPAEPLASTPADRLRGFPTCIPVHTITRFGTAGLPQSTWARLAETTAKPMALTTAVRSWAVPIPPAGTNTRFCTAAGR